MSESREMSEAFFVTPDPGWWFCPMQGCPVIEGSACCELTEHHPLLGSIGMYEDATAFVLMERDASIKAIQAQAYPEHPDRMSWIIFSGERVYFNG